MKIIGCDFHPSWQQIAVFDAETGELSEFKLVNGDGEAERFYRAVEAPALVGIEACGNSQWLIDLLLRLGHEVWVGAAAPPGTSLRLTMPSSLSRATRHARRCATTNVDEV